MRMTPPDRIRLLVVLACAFLLVLTPGCGASKGKVRGKVTMSNGEPLPGGTITFAPVSGKGNLATAWINPDGTYELEAPTGECKISIDNRNVGKTPDPPVGAGGSAGPPAGAAKTAPPTAGGGPAGGPVGGPAVKGPPGGMTGPPGGMKGPPGGMTGPPGGMPGGKAGAAPESKEKGEIEAAMAAAGRAPSGPSGQVQPGTLKPINAKYYRIETSGLSYTVQGGEQTHDIKLDP